jgi:hypothetical protein
MVPWAIVVIVALVAIVSRVVWSSHAELEAGREAYQRGDREAAVFHLKHAAHWYAPGNPFVTKALQELRQIARQAEMEGQTELALASYRAIRTSCLGTRSFYTPHSERLREANQRIANLLARQPAAPMDRTKTATQRREAQERMLERIEQPSPFWSFVVGLGFLLWIGAAVGFILRGVDDELHLVRGPAVIWSVAFVAGLGLWILGLVQA